VSTPPPVTSIVTVEERLRRTASVTNLHTIRVSQFCTQFGCHRFKALTATLTLVHTGMTHTLWRYKQPEQRCLFQIGSCRGGMWISLPLIFEACSW